MSEWVGRKATVLKNRTAEQKDRGPVDESESLTLLHAGALKTTATVVYSSPNLPPSFPCVWWDTLPWHLTSQRLPAC